MFELQVFRQPPEWHKWQPRNTSTLKAVILLVFQILTKVNQPYNSTEMKIRCPGPFLQNIVNRK